jgi:hypothetical protein
MGAESSCTLERDRRSVSGRALLESDHLLFRSDAVRLKVPFSEMTVTDVRDDALHINTQGDTLALRLPPGIAVKWLGKIRNPRSLLDKLGVKEGMKVVVLSVRDPEFLAQLESRVGSYSTRSARNTDIVFLGVETLAGLERLSALRESLVAIGAIWVVHRKGKEAPLRDVDVFAAARRVGLVDNKVAGFSATHTAERLVIPKGAR